MPATSDWHAGLAWPTEPSPKEPVWICLSVGGETLPCLGPTRTVTIGPAKPWQSPWEWLQGQALVPHSAHDAVKEVSRERQDTTKEQVARDRVNSRHDGKVGEGQDLLNCTQVREAGLPSSSQTEKYFYKRYGVTNILN